MSRTNKYLTFSIILSFDKCVFFDIFPLWDNDRTIQKHLSNIEIITEQLHRAEKDLEDLVSLLFSLRIANDAMICISTTLKESWESEGVNGRFKRKGKTAQMFSC